MKILYVTTISDTVNAFLIPHIKMLVDKGHQVDVAFRTEQIVKSEILSFGCKIYDLPMQRSPLALSNFIAYKVLKNIIISEGYDLVHTHTPVASTIVRLVCRKLINVKVYYTAHGFHFYKGAPLINWLVYYPIEKWLSRYTDTLITINKEDFERAKTSLKSKKVKYVPGVGLNVDKFVNINIDIIAKRNKLGISQDKFTVLSVGELNKNKNHETIIKAIAKLNNPNINYVICGKGKHEFYLKKISKNLGIEDSIIFLGFRNDIAEICKICDIFVFPSIREGLPVSLMEAMASGLPVVCSNIRGNNDLISNERGGFLRNSNDSDGFAEAINILYKNKELRDKMKEINLATIEMVKIENVNNELLSIYGLI